MSSPVVYPQGAAATPITIPVAMSGEQVFTFPAAAAGTTMFLNFVVFGSPPKNAPGVSPTTPAVAVLHDILGTTYKTLSIGSFVTVTTGDGGNVDVELQQHPSNLDGVYQLIFSPENNYPLGGTTWKIQWTNMDLSAIQVTFLVDTADTVLPWIGFPLVGATDFSQASTLTPLTDAPQPPWTTPVQLICGQTYDLSVPIYNYGPAPLSINITADITVGQFSILPKTTTIAPGGGDVLTVQLASQSNPGALNSAGSPAVLAVPSADTTHPGTLSFYTTVGNMEFVFALDVSGSMATVGPDNTTRWSQLQGAMAAVMSHLQSFANGGTWAALLYPPTQGSGSTQVIQTPTAITATSSLGLTYNPTNGTPMGPAIYDAMGHPTQSPTSDCGLFVPDDSNPQHQAAFQYDHRWLVLMTDGAANIGDDPATFGSSYYSARNVKAITIGFGIGGQTNPGTLTTIATNAGGQYFAPDPGTGDPSNSLPTKFLKAVSASLALNFSADPSAILPATQGATNKHSVIVTTFDRKVSFVLCFLTTVEAQFAAVSLITPSGEVVTPRTAASVGVKYAVGPLSKSYFVDFANRGTRSLGGAGTWTIVVSFAPADTLGNTTAFPESFFRGIRYAYQSIVDSDLTLNLGSGGELHYAGNPITLSAALAVNGQPVSGASVTAQLAGSGQGYDNWLASQLVTDAEYRAALEALGAMHDIQAQFVKAFALTRKGIKYPGTGSARVLTLAQDPRTGAYETTYAGTNLPGTYKFLVTATGHDDKGNLFERNKPEEIVVQVMPDEASTIIDLTYQVVSNQMQAVLRFWLRDPLGNIYLVDPTITNIVQVLLQGGAMASGPLKGNLDGSYTQIFLYPLNATPIVSISVNGNHVVPSLIPPNFSKLMFVDEVIGYKKGREAKAGDNIHVQPQQALGDPSRKPLTQFVSLGGLGSATFAIKGKTIQAQAVTVFISADTSLRAYAVDVLAAAAGVGWIEIGRSIGVTQTFSLLPRPKCACAEPKGSYVAIEGKVFGDTFDVTVPLEASLHPPPDPVARLRKKGVLQIRIRDLSNMVLNPDRSPSSSPGVSVLAIGFTP